MLKIADGKWKGRQLIAPQPLLDADTPPSVSQPPASAIDRTGFYGFGVDMSYDYSGRLRLSHSGAFAQGAATNYVLLPDQASSPLPIPARPERTRTTSGPTETPTTDRSGSWSADPSSTC